MKMLRLAACWIRKYAAPAFLLPLVLMACSGPALKKEIIRDPPSYALSPADHGPLADIASDIRINHGAEYSGFRLLDKSFDALNWRLALIDSATASLDIQTYLWYPDYTGKLILERSVAAANRGVKVRLIVDDLLTLGLDQLLFELQQHPNISLRLFNPWEDRSTLSRAGEMIAQLERLNTRMHDKLVIADGRAAIVGGRNIGDHYFGLSEAYNFHDLDLLGIGNIAIQAQGMFDSFWNSEWVVSAKNLDTQPDPEFVKATQAAIDESIRTSREYESFPRQVKDWSAELETLKGELHPGTSQLIYDQAEGETIQQNVASEIFSMLDLARKDLWVTNAYVIPAEKGIAFVQSLTDRGVKVRILTNSLASHDVPAVNSHYRDWRDDFINAGAELYELRADAAIKSLVEVPPIQAEFVGLHTKAFVADDRWSFIGSFNFDPRSANINAEGGALVDSPGLARDLARVMQRDMSPENAWQVFLDSDGKAYWVNSDETVYKQPARNGTQRIMDKIFKIFPKDQY